MCITNQNKFVWAFSISIIVFKSLIKLHQNFSYYKVTIIHQSRDVWIDHTLKGNSIEKFFDGKELIVWIFEASSALNDQILFAKTRIQRSFARIAKRIATSCTHNRHFLNYLSIESKNNLKLRSWKLFKQDCFKICFEVWEKNTCRGLGGLFHKTS